MLMKETRKGERTLLNIRDRDWDIVSSFNAWSKTTFNQDII